MLKVAEGRDFLDEVDDQVGSPTSAADLAKTILTILPKIENDTVEVFHYSNAGICSWYDFAKAIFEIEGLPIKVSPIESSLYSTPALRPFYSVLNKEKIKSMYGIKIPYWRNLKK